MAAQMTNELTRIRYWQGQLLAAGDLQTQLFVDEELRRLHNRVVHHAYGVAIGLEAKLEDGEFTLGCGLAYDCAGRALIVAADRVIPLPTPVTDQALVIAYDPNSVDGIALAWKPAPEVKPNTEIELTRLIQDLIELKLNNRFRPIARPLARPRMASGNTIPGETPWQPWKIGETEVGVKVLIDTSAVGFTREPYYFAEVIAGKATSDFVPAWFMSIDDPSTQGFTLQLMLRRITRESLEIADPKTQVAAPPTLDQAVTVEALNPLVPGDRVARLLPLAERASVIKTLTIKTGVVTLADALDDLKETKAVAFGHAPRLARVVKVSEPKSFFEVTVDNTEPFIEGQVVVKLGAHPENARPARIATVDDSGILELLTAITGLAVDDTLGIVQQESVVQTIDGLRIKVADPALFVKADVVVRLGEGLENSVPATIVSKEADGTLVLSGAITGLIAGSSLGIARAASTVLNVVDNAKKVDIEVDNTKPFNVGDLVARSSGHGSFSAPVRVEHIITGKKILRLSGSILGLLKDDIIVGADFPVRATVLETPGTTVKVTAATRFPKDSHVALIDELLKASLPAAVNKSEDQIVTLDAAIANLKAGDVIGLCAFPSPVEVKDVRDDGSIVVSDADGLREADVLTALPARTGLAIVAKKEVGNVIRLAGKIPNLATGDKLWAATIGGVINATPTATDTKVNVDKPERLRVGDFLADIKGWRQAQPGAAATASVITASDNQMTLTALLDGLLLHDTIGLASLTQGPFIGFNLTFLELRLNKMLDLRPGDEALLVGLDRLRGETQSTLATVLFAVALVDPPINRVVLKLESNLGQFTFRPEDISVGVLFVRGSALALIQEHDLFVSWLAVGESGEMPKPCDGKVVQDCPCAPAKE
jgi:hypothetical protein